MLRFASTTCNATCLRSRQPNTGSGESNTQPPRLARSGLSAAREKLQMGSRRVACQLHVGCMRIPGAAACLVLWPGRWYMVIAITSARQVY